MFPEALIRCLEFPALLHRPRAAEAPETVLHDNPSRRLGIADLLSDVQTNGYTGRCPPCSRTLWLIRAVMFFLPSDLDIIADGLAVPAPVGPEEHCRAAGKAVGKGLADGTSLRVLKGERIGIAVLLQQLEPAELRVPDTSLGGPRSAYHD